MGMTIISNNHNLNERVQTHEFLVLIHLHVHEAIHNQHLNYHKE
jgi:hypothetical protein